MDNNTLRQKLEERQWESESVIRDNEALRNEIATIRGQLAEMHDR